MSAKLLFFIVEYANLRRSLKVISKNFLQRVWGTKENIVGKNEIRICFTERGNELKY